MQAVVVVVLTTQVGATVALAVVAMVEEMTLVYLLQEQVNPILVAVVVAVVILTLNLADLE
jgi:hypothetical protein